MRRALIALLLCACHPDTAIRVPPTELEPASFAPMPAPRALNGLGIRWVGSTGLSVVVRGVSSEHLFIEWGETVELRRLSDGVSVRRQVIPPGGSAFAADMIVAWPILAPIQAIDPISGAVRWQHDVHVPLHPFPTGDLVAETAREIVASAAVSPTERGVDREIGVIGLDRTTGALDFQTSVRDVRSLIADRDLVFVGADRTLMAIHDRDGTTAWRWELAAADRPGCLVVRPLVVSGDALVAGRDCRSLLVLHRTRGTLHREIQLDRDLIELDVAGPIAYAALGSDDDNRSGVVRAIDLRTGRTLWEAPIGTVGYWTRVIAIDGALLAIASDGEMRALDPATGRTTASLSLGSIHEVLLSRSASSFTLITRTETGRIVAVEPRESAPPPLPVHLHLRVIVHREYASSDDPLAHARVSIGGATHTADANGEIDTTLRALGAVEVELDAAQIADESAHAPLGCFVMPLELYPQDGAEQAVDLVLFCAARC